MPCLTLSTNVTLEGVDTSSILSEASSSIAKILGKPENYVMVLLKGSVPVSFGGTEQPAAFGELISIGGLNPATNKKLSAAIAAANRSQEHIRDRISGGMALLSRLGCKPLNGLLDSSIL
ncbi:hypothetical protein V2J09_018589 [Rumex salicifolius]